LRSLSPTDLIMILTIHGTFLQATFVNEETGQPMYRTSTPNRWSNRVTTLYRVPPGGLDEVALATDTTSDSPDTNLVHRIAEMELESEPLASIHWKVFSPSQVEHDFQTVSVHELLPKDGPFKTSYSFTAPDGFLYHWSSGLAGKRPPVLTLDDGTTIAKYHSGDLFGPRKKSLEIFARGERILDIIVLTFLYVEKRRRDR